MDEPHFFVDCRKGTGLLPKDKKIRRLESTKDDKDFRSSESNDLSELSQKDGFQLVHYDGKLVKKAIHLYRNPFHNIVSRFHLDLTNSRIANETDKLELYANNEKGFQRWCQDLDAAYEPDPNQPNEFLASDVLMLMKDVPCRGEVYRYVQWHNLANAVVTHNHKPTIIIHYEDYDKKWNETATAILDFLHLTYQGTTKSFSAKLDYDSYFSRSQQQKAMLLMKRLATDPVWQEIERYFSDL